MSEEEQNATLAATPTTNDTIMATPTTAWIPATYTNVNHPYIYDLHYGSVDTSNEDYKKQYINPIAQYLHHEDEDDNDDEWPAYEDSSYSGVTDIFDGADGPDGTEDINPALPSESREPGWDCAGVYYPEDRWTGPFCIDLVHYPYPDHLTRGRITDVMRMH